MLKKYAQKYIVQRTQEVLEHDKNVKFSFWKTKFSTLQNLVDFLPQKSARKPANSSRNFMFYILSENY